MLLATIRHLSDSTMIGKKSLLHLAIACLTLPLGWAVSSAWEAFAVAAPRAERVSSARQIAQTFQPPSDKPPRNGAGGATRGSCSHEDAVVPLMPRNKLGLTLAEHPTLFVYVPKTSAKELKFSLLDREQGAVLYEMNIETPSQPGIVSITLPASSSPALEKDKTYYWFLEIVCNENDASGNSGVDGWVKRIEPSEKLNEALEKASEGDRAKVYAENGIWYEAAQASAEERSANPAGWEELLRSVGLSEIAAEPMVECCTAQN